MNCFDAFVILITLSGPSEASSCLDPIGRSQTRGSLRQLRNASWKSYCELMWAVSRCVSMYLLHRIVFHVWSSGTLLELNVFKCLQDLQVLPGMLRQILWRSYVRSPSPWFTWFRITGMWPCLCLWDLNEFPAHGLFFGEIFLILCSKLFYNMFQKCLDMF